MNGYIYLQEFIQALAKQNLPLPDGITISRGMYMRMARDFYERYGEGKDKLELLSGQEILDLKGYQWMLYCGMRVEPGPE